MVLRQRHLDDLLMFKDKRLIKVVTGIRRGGKSTLLEQMQDAILRENANAKIVSINFEEKEFQPIATSEALVEKVASMLDPTDMNYVFLDEIQHVEAFEKAVDALFVMKNVDLYLTGSNAKLLSGEIATLLSGRYVEIKMQPLSYAEYLSFNREWRAGTHTYNDYVMNSSFPYSLELRPNVKAVDIYLSGLYATLILKDVVQRRKIQDTDQLERVVRFLFDNIGNLTSIQAISDSLSSTGRKVSPQTVEKYIAGLKDAYIVYEAERYNVRGKDLLKSGVKYYAADMGLRRVVLGGAMRDYGRVLENLVYLELKRRYSYVNVGVVGDREVDFVARSAVNTSESLAYYQVAASVRDENTLEREIRPLKLLNDNYPKYLITLDDDPKMDIDGIRQISVFDFMTNS